MRIVSVGFHLLVFTVQISIPLCAAQEYPEWQGGDWAMEYRQFTDEPFDDPEEWAHSLRTLGGEYDEIPKTKSTRPPFVPASKEDLWNDPPDWYPLTPYEIPYLAVLYRRNVRRNSNDWNELFPYDPEPKDSLIFPRTACGGAVLSPRHVITSCGCLVTLITKLFKIPNPLPGGSHYDIQDPLNNDDTIYVLEHAATGFEPDFSHRIDTHPNKWSQRSTMNCKHILSELDSTYRNSDARKKEAMVNGAAAVVPVTPEIRPTFFRYFPKWPPLTFNSDTKPFERRVQIISIGMRLLKPGRMQFFSSISASATELIHCKVTNDIVCNASRVDMKVTHTCYCPLWSGIQKMTGGVIGWPLVQKGYLVGITGSERLTATGTVLAITMDNTLIEEIEKYITKQVLESQNTPSPGYRSRELKKQYLVYDYNDFRRKSFIHPDSKATTNGPALFTVPVTIVFWISTA